MRNVKIIFSIDLAYAQLRRRSSDRITENGDPPTEALTLTAAEAAEIYHAVPARTDPCEDGKPNRPLTAFTVVFVPVPDPAKELTSMGLMQAGPASAGPLECRGALAEHAVHLAGPQLGGISDVALVFRQ